MNIIKYEHACLDVREGTSRLVIDPGIFLTSMTDFSSINALVITHIHPDHFDPGKISAIIAANSDVQIYTTQEVAEQISSPNITVPGREQTLQVDTFTLEFFGTDHAMIDPGYPLAQNMGVLVNDTLYYPGD